LARDGLSAYDPLRTFKITTMNGRLNPPRPSIRGLIVALRKFIWLPIDLIEINAKNAAEAHHPDVLEGSPGVNARLSDGRCRHDRCRSL
jgi:hypothetical protein